MEPASLRVMGEHPGAMRIGSWNNVVICAWRGQATAAAVETLAKLMVALHAGSSEVRSYIHLIPDQAGLPDAAARSGVSGIMSTYEPFIACVGVVIAGNGFWASAMRSVVTGLRLLLRTPFEYRLHAHADELLAWFPHAHTARTHVLITSQQLHTLLQEAQRWQTEVLP